MSLIDWIGNFIPLVSTSTALVSFWVGFLGGAEVFFLLAFLCAQGIFDFKMALLFCFLGNILSESIYFSIGRIEHLSALKSWRVTSNGYKKMSKMLHKIGRGHPIVLLSLSKFIYGTGIATIVYLGIEKLEFKKFFAYSFLVNLFWIPFIMALGWFSGKGFIKFTNSVEDIKLTILLVVVLLSGFYLLHRWISKKLLNNQEVEKNLKKI